jgi:hypothetical protein
MQRAAAYLPESMALVQSAIVPSESRYLTHEEMMTIEDTVHGIIEVLSQSDKPQDVKVSEELFGLYNIRSPYIWTRVRAVKPRTPKTDTPQSPSLIIDALQNLSISSESKTTTQQARFADLEYQQDIICTLTKTLPSAVQIGQPNRASSAIVVSWAVDLRQLDITMQGAKQPTPWMFFSLRQSRFGRPGQQQYRPRQPQNQQQLQQQLHQRQQQQQNQREQQEQQEQRSYMPPQHQAREIAPDTRKPQNARHTPQPHASTDNPGRRWTKPTAPHAPPQAPPAAPTNVGNNNQRISGRKPTPAPGGGGRGPLQPQKQQGKRLVDGTVLSAENEVLVSSAN